MFRWTREDGRPTILATTVKSTAAVAALSYLAANWLSSVDLDQRTLGRVASDAGRGLDPAVTGSIGARASATRLDPCTLPPRR